MSELRYCPIKNSECSIDVGVSVTPLCFIAIPFREEMEDTRTTVTKVLKRHGIQSYIADEEVTTARDILCKICEKITFSDFGIIELTSINPNVMLEFGIILGRRKPVFILLNKKVKTGPEGEKIPADIIALERIEYSSQKSLQEKFEKGIEQYLGKLDRKRRETDAMMQLALASARDRELLTTEKLLDIIFERMQVAKGKDGKFVDLLEEIKVEVEPINHPRYWLALARVYCWNGQIEKSVECAKNAIHQRSVVFKKAFEERKDKIKKSTLENIVKGKLFVRNPIFAVYEGLEKSGEPVMLDAAFSVLLCIMEITTLSEKVVGVLTARLKDSFKKRIPMYPSRLRSALWEPNTQAFDIVSVLTVFAENETGKEEKAKNIAKSCLKSMDEILAGYYRLVALYSRVI